ncbi:MAG TPA: hypothetical protein DHW22_02190 [Planctomycetaceae bacterium]|nr:hypothetical protein [Planctomycetaceae bacterium]
MPIGCIKYLASAAKLQHPKTSYQSQAIGPRTATFLCCQLPLAGNRNATQVPAATNYLRTLDFGLSMTLTRQKRVVT